MLKESSPELDNIRRLQGLLGADVSEILDRLYKLEQWIGDRNLPMPVCNAIRELQMMYGNLKSLLQHQTISSDEIAEHVNALPVMVALRDMMERTKKHDERMNDRMLGLERKFNLLDNYVGEKLSKSSSGLCKSSPGLLQGQIYKASKVIEPDIYIVIIGRDGNQAVKSFPKGKYYRPKDLHWDNLELVGTLSDLINP